MKYLNERNILAAWSRFLLYTKAWRTNKKIIVIESDDWGSIRTSTKEAYKHLESLGYKMGHSAYTIDALENNTDLEELFNILLSHSDTQGNPACFTANMIMANPNFKKIKEDNYQLYYYEKVDKTLNKYSNREKVEYLWLEGNEKNIFFPQLHAREHVRYWEWLKDLQQKKKETIETFELGMCGVPLKVSKQGMSYYKPLFIDDSILHSEGIDLNVVINEAFDLFYQTFGYKSLSTVAPNVAWTDSVEKIWVANKVKYIQGGFLQEHHFENKVKYKPHYLGQKSEYSSMSYLVRNCNFEPANSKKADYWKSTLKQIERAFQFNTPAIISSHRVNYIGSINSKNRENSLIQLNLLLKAVKKQWPDVIFLSSVQLGELISERV